MNNNAIEAAFLQQGYTFANFTLNGAGHPILAVELEGQVQTNILLDTGASANLLDYHFAQQLGLNLRPTGTKGAGAGGVINEVYSIDAVSLNIQGELFVFDNFLAMDFASIKQSLIANGLAANFDGILGFGFFKTTACFIDYAADRIFMLNPQKG